MTGPGESTKGYDFDDVIKVIIGCAIEVHRQLGPGFLEVTYQRALAMELGATGADFSREVDVPIYYKGEHIDTRRVDFVVENCIVEIKARKELLDADVIQALIYLKASAYPLGLLINFGEKRVKARRLVGPTYQDKEHSLSE
jgi:GxxExxY protein